MESGAYLRGGVKKLASLELLVGRKWLKICPKALLYLSSNFCSACIILVRFLSIDK